MAHEDGDEIFCSEECAERYRADNEEEKEEGE
jgi:YHS domain-containing protein